MFVVFGTMIALTGGWIQLHPERVVPGQSGPGHATECGADQLAACRIDPAQIDPAARVQIRVLGACFLFMGFFFALQMTVDLMGRPWWIGTLSGLVTSIAAVTLVHARVRRQQQRGRRIIQQSPLPGKVLELR